MTIDITYRSILKVLGTLVALWLMFQVWDILAITFFGIIIAAAVTPEVDKMHREGVPRIFGAILIYLLIGLLFTLLIYIVLPPTIYEVSRLSSDLPRVLSEYAGSLSLPQTFFDQISQNLANASTDMLTWIIGLAGGLGNILFVIIISFYLTVEDEGIKRFLQDTLPADKYPHILELILRSQNTLSQWLKAQLLLMILVGLMTFLAYSIIGIPNALALGTFAGLLEIIPFIGPIIASVPAIIFALNISPFTALLVVIIFTIIQQIEAQILTPQIMKRAFAINPIIVLIAIFIGGKLGGIIGVLASVPLLALAIEFSKGYYNKLRLK